MPICTRSKAKKVSDPVATSTATSTTTNRRKNNKKPSTSQDSMEPVVVLSPLRHNRFKEEDEVPQPKKATRPRPKVEGPVQRARIPSAAAPPPSPSPSIASFRSLRNVKKKTTKAGPQPRLFSHGNSSSSDSDDDAKDPPPRSLAKGRLPSSRIAKKATKENVPEKGEFLAPAGPAPKARAKPTKKAEKQSVQSLPSEDESDGRRTRSLRPRGKDNKAVTKPFVNADLANVVPAVLAAECRLVGNLISNGFSSKTKQDIRLNKFREKAITSLADAVERAKARKVREAEVKKNVAVNVIKHEDKDLFEDDEEEEEEEKEPAAVELPKKSNAIEAKKTNAQETKKSNAQEVKKSNAQEVKKSNAQEMKRSNAQEAKKSNVKEANKSKEPTIASATVKNVDVDIFEEEEEEEESKEVVEQPKKSIIIPKNIQEASIVTIHEEDDDLFEDDDEEEDDESEIEAVEDAVERTKKRKAQESHTNVDGLEEEEDDDNKEEAVAETKKSVLPQEKAKSPIKFNFLASAEEEAIPVQANKKFIMEVNDGPDDDSQDDVFEDVFDKSIVEEGPIAADETYLNSNATFVLKNSDATFVLNKPKPAPTFNETINLTQPKFGMHIPTFGMHDFNTSKHHTSTFEVIEEEDDNCNDNPVFKLPPSNVAGDKKKKKETSSSSSSSAASFKSAISQPKRSFSKVKLAKGLWSEKQKQKEENAKRMKEQIIKSKQEVQKQKNDEWRLKTEKIRLENEKKKTEALKKLNKPGPMVPSAGGSSGTLNKILGPMVPHKAPQIKPPINSITRLVENINLTPSDKPSGPMKAFNKPLQFPNPIGYSQQTSSMAFSNPTFATTPIKASSSYLQKSQDMFKTPNTSTSFFDITADSGGSTYDITRYEDLDEEMRHRENKPVPKWANNKSEISKLLFKQLYVREAPGPGFPFPSVKRGYKLFRQPH